jgi:pimeloyl-ACP methyl ester carboxylesterase
VLTTLLGWLALGLAAFLVLTILAFWLAVHPPRLTARLTPADVGLPVEEIVVEAPDGVRLAGWLAVRRGRPCVILLHGYPADKSDLLPLAAALHRRFTVLLMDLRYFGASEGRVTTLGHRERLDLRRVLDRVEARNLGPVGVFGFSLGGAVALLAAAEDARIRAVAAYSPFADLRALARETYAHFWLLREPLVDLMRLWSRVFLGADITRPSPEQAARRLTIPVLLVHSAGDEQIPVAHAERLRRALADNALAAVQIEPAGLHGALGERFEDRLVTFFAGSLDTGR